MSSSRGRPLHFVDEDDDVNMNNVNTYLDLADEDYD